MLAMKPLGKLGKGDLEDLSANRLTECLNRILYRVEPVVGFVFGGIAAGMMTLESGRKICPARNPDVRLRRNLV